MKQDPKLTIPIFVGYDHRERAATNVLIDSLYHKSSLPVSITPLVTSQLKNQSKRTFTNSKHEAKTINIETNVNP